MYDFERCDILKKFILEFVLSCILVISGCGTVADTPKPTTQTESKLWVQFIDVGQADAALVKCDGKSMLIDGGNTDDSNVIAAVLKKNNITYLDYVVCTHAHEDHVGGLAGALSVADAGTVLAPQTGADTKSYRNFLKKAENRGVGITHPKGGDNFSLGGSKIEILGPVTENPENVNNTSIVLKIICGETSFLFTGDAERESEELILNKGFDVSADVLKVGHHGSSSSTSYRFLREVMPEYAVISCGRDNSYGHPHSEVLSRLRDSGAELYRTDLQGDIIFTSDGKTVSVNTDKNSQITTNPTSKPKTEGTYIGNKNSKKFHRPDCDADIKEENKIILYSRTEAVEKGYTPCKSCKP